MWRSQTLHSQFFLDLTQELLYKKCGLFSQKMAAHMANGMQVALIISPFHKNCGMGSLKGAQA